MFNWKLTVLLASALILSGCTKSLVTADLPKLDTVPTAHVNWPTPINPCSASLQVETREFDQGAGGAVVVIPYKDYLEVQACTASKQRYVNSLTSMVCFYRQDLAEKRCNFYYPTSKKE